MEIIKKDKEENNNLNNKEQKSKSNLFGETYKLCKENIKQVSVSDSNNNKNSKDDITSTSHIVDDIKYNFINNCKEIYNDMSQILDKSTFIFNMKEKKVIVNF